MGDYIENATQTAQANYLLLRKLNDEPLDSTRDNSGGGA